MTTLAIITCFSHGFGAGALSNTVCRLDNWPQGLRRDLWQAGSAQMQLD